MVYPKIDSERVEEIIKDLEGKYKEYTTIIDDLFIYIKKGNIINSEEHNIWLKELNTKIFHGSYNQACGFFFKTQNRLEEIKTNINLGKTKVDKALLKEIIKLDIEAGRFNFFIEKLLEVEEVQLKNIDLDKSKLDKLKEYFSQIQNIMKDLNVLCCRHLKGGEHELANNIKKICIDHLKNEYGANYHEAFRKLTSKINQLESIGNKVCTEEVKFDKVKGKIQDNFISASLIYHDLHKFFELEKHLGQVFTKDIDKVEKIAKEDLKVIKNFQKQLSLINDIVESVEKGKKIIKSDDVKAFVKLNLLYENYAKLPEQSRPMGADLLEKKFTEVKEKFDNLATSRFGKNKYKLILEDYTNKLQPKDNNIAK